MANEYDVTNAALAKELTKKYHVKEFKDLNIYQIIWVNGNV
jgi:hypothetical protein